MIYTSSKVRFDDHRETGTVCSCDGRVLGDEYKRCTGSQSSFCPCGLNTQHTGGRLIVLDGISWVFGIACLMSPNKRERTTVGAVAFVTLASYRVHVRNNNSKSKDVSVAMDML